MKKLTFKTFLEARQEFIDKIQDAVDKVSDRPFNELFENKGERFLVKVINPNIQKATELSGINLSDYNPDTRTINGENINTFIKKHKKRAMARYQHEFDPVERRKELISAFRDEFYTQISNIMKYGTVDSSLQFEPWSDWGAILKDSNRRDACILNKKYIQSLGYEFHTPLTANQIRKFLEKIRDGDIPRTAFFEIGQLLKPFIRLTDSIDSSVASTKQLYMAPLRAITQIKQAIDQNNLEYYLLFSRHPIDVLRMSDHKGISSCHKLGGGKYSKDEGLYQYCAIADAENSGGIVYLIKGSDAKKIKNQLQEKEVFFDADRKTGNITPLGRIRLRRFIDIKTGDDFAVPTTFSDETKYGYFTKELHTILMQYIREHQAITQSPPSTEYAINNIVLVGGTYSDEELNDLLNNYFETTSFKFGQIKHQKGHLSGWEDELAGMRETILPGLLPFLDINLQAIRGQYGNPSVLVRIETTMKIPFIKGTNLEHFDIVLSEEIDAHRILTNTIFSKQVIATFNNVPHQRSEWNNGVLTTNITFNVNDPQAVYPILESAIKAKNIWYKYEKAMSNAIYDKVAAMSEE
jgi:hypothetical protein